jgi:hypothetical protein
VAEAKPYLFHPRGRLAYCLLDQSVRSSGLFGNPDEIDMIFPTEQDYYHDIGPRYK